VQVAWRGAPDFANSSFAADPRRVRPDGASPSALVLVPRDAQGIPFGPGRAVAFSLQGAAGATVGAAQDLGDGSYAAEVVAGAVREEIAVSALVDGDDLGGTIPVGIGFPLGPVLDAGVADLGAAIAADPPPPARALPRMARARDLLVLARAIPPGEEAAILAKAGAAIRHLEAAARRGAGTDPLARELAEAGRQAAIDALANASPLADTAAEIRALGRGLALRDAAEALLAEGRWSRAAARLRAVLRKAARIR
jgi:hypothetical protein